MGTHKESAMPKTKDKPTDPEADSRANYEEALQKLEKPDLIEMILGSREVTCDMQSEMRELMAELRISTKHETEIAEAHYWLGQAGVPEGGIDREKWGVPARINWMIASNAARLRDLTDVVCGAKDDCGGLGEGDHDSGDGGDEECRPRRRRRGYGRRRGGGGGRRHARRCP
jgi:hypothetical protein